MTDKKSKIECLPGLVEVEEGVVVDAEGRLVTLSPPCPLLFVILLFVRVLFVMVLLGMVFRNGVGFGETTEGDGGGAREASSDASPAATEVSSSVVLGLASQRTREQAAT